MGRDTKIGLLVGLSFILLFGIILAKRSAEVDQLSGPETSEVALAEDLVQTPAAEPNWGLTRPAPQEAQTETLMVSGDLAATAMDETGAPVSTPSETLRPDGELAELDGDGQAPAHTPGLTTGPELPGNVQTDLTAAARQDSAISFAQANLSPPPPTAPVVTAAASVTVPNVEEPVVAHADPTASDGTLLAVTRGTNTGARGRATGTPSRPTQPQAATPQTAGSKTYVVKPGDSFFVIARREYGDGKLWRKIFDANRKEVPDPDLLRPGQRLVIPRQGTPRATRPVRPQARTANRVSSGSTVQTIRTTPLRTLETRSAAGSYKVQPGDNLTRIAARVLKDGSRALLIYELNKDKLRNPDVVPVGIVLRLPTQAQAARIAATPAARR